MWLPKEIHEAWNECLIHILPGLWEIVVQPPRFDNFVGNHNTQKGQWYWACRVRVPFLVVI